MADQPRIVTRDEQPYVAIAATVTMDDIAAAADRLPEVMAWVAARGLARAGAPFFKYDVIAMPDRLQMQVGAPLRELVEGEGDIVAGLLPAGRYAMVSHIGHPKELMGVTTDLLAWADRQGLAFDMTSSPDGERWGCRLEAYHSDPRLVPDMAQWHTDLLFRLAELAGPRLRSDGLAPP